MPFYLGNYRANVYLGDQLCNFLINVNKITNIIPNNALISSDNFYLKDKNNIYLTCLTTSTILYTSNGEMLTDADGNTLIIDGEE